MDYISAFLKVLRMVVQISNNQPAGNEPGKRQPDEAGSVFFVPIPDTKRAVHPLHGCRVVCRKVAGWLHPEGLMPYGPELLWQL